MLTNVAPLEAKPSFKTRTSGYFNNHYAPNARVFLDAQPNIGDGFIALKEIPTPHGAIRLAAPKDLQEFAFLLYDSFRQADNLGIESVCVSTPPKIGIGVAIIDRLNKSRYGN
jgi:L-threonylcarbamoyladenylate synthase